MISRGNSVVALILLLTALAGGMPTSAEAGWREMLEKGKNALIPDRAQREPSPTLSVAPDNTNKNLTADAQTMLNSMGYDAGPVDGSYGQRTRVAIRQFQSAQGIFVNGNVSPALIQQLGNAGGKGATSGGSSNKFGAGEVVKDGVKGAAACGGIAALLGLDKKTVVWSAALCGAANAGVTYLAQSGQKEYATKYETISKDMVDAEKDIQKLEAATNGNYKKVNDYGHEVDRLIAREKDDQAFIEKAAVLREELDDQIRENRRSRLTAEAKLNVLEDDIKDLDAIIAENPDINELKQTRTALKGQKLRLADNIKKSNGINENLNTAKIQLDEETIKRS